MGGLLRQRESPEQTDIIEKSRMKALVKRKSLRL